MVTSVKISQIKSIKFMDFGSGNSRIAATTSLSPSSINLVEIDYGTISFGNKIKENPNLGVEIEKEVAAKVSQSPALGNQFREFVVVGGTPYAVFNLLLIQKKATLSADKKYIVTTYTHFKNFVNTIEKSGKLVVPSNITEKEKETLSSILDMASYSDIINGTKLMEHVWKGLGMSSNAQIKFPVQSGWTLGYLVFNLKN
jgi:hypothetical protein